MDIIALQEIIHEKSRQYTTLNGVTVVDENNNILEIAKLDMSNKKLILQFKENIHGN